MDDIIFKTELLKGAKGDRGDAGEADSIPVDGVIIYEGETIPDGFEETTPPEDITDTQGMIGDEYDSTASYNAGDYCTYEGVLYKCNATTTGDFDATKWDATTAAGEIKTNTAAIETNTSEIEDNASAIEAIVNEYSAKNLLPLNLDTIKGLNSDGTWSGNTYTINGGTITVNTNENGSVTSIVANGGPFTSLVSFYLIGGSPVFESNKYILNGITGGSSTTYCLTYLTPGWDWGTLNDGEKLLNVDVSRVRINIQAGATLNSVTFKPMIRDARITDPTYAPYAMTNEQLMTRIVTTRHSGKTMGNGAFQIWKLPGYYLASVTLDILGGYLCSWGKYSVDSYYVFPLDYDHSTGSLTFLNDFDTSVICTWVKE